VKTILLNAVFDPSLEIIHHSGQLLLIDREHFFSDGIHSSTVTQLAFH
jgi:hypothetical protein